MDEKERYKHAIYSSLQLENLQTLGNKSCGNRQTSLDRALLFLAICFRLGAIACSKLGAPKSLAPIDPASVTLDLRTLTLYIYCHRVGCLKQLSVAVKKETNNWKKQKSESRFQFGGTIKSQGRKEDCPSQWSRHHWRAEYFTGAPSGHPFLLSEERGWPWLRAPSQDSADLLRLAV